MATREVNLDLLLGKQVLDPDGKNVGRIEEMCAVRQGDDYIIQDFLVGRAAELERLSFLSLGLRLLGFLGAHKLPPGYRVSWDKLDLSDPNHPRLCCSREDLQPLEEEENKEQRTENK